MILQYDEILLLSFKILKAYSIVTVYYLSVRCMHTCKYVFFVLFFMYVLNDCVAVVHFRVVSSFACIILLSCSFLVMWYVIEV